MLTLRSIIRFLRGNICHYDYCDFLALVSKNLLVGALLRRPHWVLYDEWHFLQFFTRLVLRIHIGFISFSSVSSSGEKSDVNTNGYGTTFA